MPPEVSAESMIKIEKPAPPGMVATLAPVVLAARGFEVRNVEEHAKALERCKALRDGERAITEAFEPARKKADEAKKEILRLRDGLIGPIAEARSIYDRKAADYEAAERRRAEEEQARLRELARKQEEERQLMAAIAAEEEGDEAAADAIMAESVTAPVVTVAPQVARVVGVVARTIWSAEVTDLHALVKYVAAHPEWLSLLEPVGKNLDAMARTQREAMSIPGVRAVSRQSSR